MKTFPDLYDYVLPDVKGCVPEMAIIAMRNALIEFLGRSLLWTFRQSTSLLTVAAQAAYTLTDVPTDARIVQITDAWLDAKPLTLAIPGALRDLYDDWEVEGGVTRYFMSDEQGRLILVPIPDTGGQVVTAKAAITYTPAVTSFEDWMFDRFYLAIADGAKAELFAMLGKPWSNPALHTKHKNDFEAAIGSAGAIHDKGYTRAALRSKSAFR